MNDDYWSKYQQSMAQSLALSLAADLKGEALDAETGLQLLCQLTDALHDARRTIHFVGNGASACMASHIAVVKESCDTHC